MNFIKRAWRGEEKLWKVFWVYGYVLPIAICYPILWIAYENKFSNIYIIIIRIVDIYSLFWAICVWRCSKNVKEDSWVILAKISVIISLFILFVNNLHDLNNSTNTVIKR